MPFLEVGEVKIHYEVWEPTVAPPPGKPGRWYTLVNGYTRPLNDYRSFAKFLAERGQRVVAFDNRGAGKAECPPVFTVDDIGDDILALWAHLNIEKSHLLGISYGGVISSHLAARESARLHSLTLVSTPFSAKFLSAERAAPSRDPKVLAGRLTRYFSPAFLKNNQLLVQGFIRQMGKIFQEPDTALGAIAQRNSMEGLDLRPLLERVTCRTLVVHGADDFIVPKESAKLIAGTVPQSQLELMPEMGHLLLVEASRKLYELVYDWTSAA